MGKTAFALNIAEHVAVQEELPVLVFSMEWARRSWRCAWWLARPHRPAGLRTGWPADDDWERLAEAVDRLRQASILHRRDAGSELLELRGARRMAQFGGTLGLIVIDYLAADERQRPANDENRATEIGEISRGLKALAKELQCPVIALSQLNRRSRRATTSGR